MRQRFDGQLAALNRELISMGALCEEAIAVTARSVLDADRALAGRISALEEEIDRYRFSRLPAILPIPGVSGNNGIGIKNVKKSVEQAVGSDIIFGS